MSRTSSDHELIEVSFLVYVVLVNGWGWGWGRVLDVDEPDDTCWLRTFNTIEYYKLRRIF